MIHVPRYDFTCPDGHTTELVVSSYDIEKILCTYFEEENPCRCGVLDCEAHLINFKYCKRMARRSEVNAPGIIFKGEGFTKKVVPMPPQTPPSVTSPQEHLENLDAFAKAAFEYDTNDRPYVREEAGLDPRE